MFLSSTPGHVACISRGRRVLVQAAKGGFGSRRNKPSKRPKQGNPEAKKLLGEYSAAKPPPADLSSTAAANRIPVTGRTGHPIAEASATTRPQPQLVPTKPGSSSSTTTIPTSSNNVSSKQGLTTPELPPTPASPTASSSSKPPTPGAPTTPAAPSAKPSATSTDQNSSKTTTTTTSNSTSSSTSDSSVPAPAAPTEPLNPLPVGPPLPETFTAAGTRITSFESKLTSKQPPAPAQPSTPAPAAAAVQPPAPAEDPAAAHAASADGATLITSVPAASIAKLGAAHVGLAAAGEHIEGLAGLLREAQATLASLSSHPEATGTAADPAAAAVSAAADSLVGMMSDVLADITGEMGLVREQLMTAAGDLDEAKQQLEAVTAAPPAVPLGKTSVKESADEDIELIAAREAAAVAAAAAAAKREAEMKQTLELRDTELAVTQQRNTQLQAQLALLMPDGSGADAAAAAAAAAASEAGADPRVHQLLVAQVASNMAMLDWLGALAKTVVGLEGVSPQDRVKLATTISKCVLAVGGSSSSRSNSPDRSTASGQQEHAATDEF